MFVCEYCLRVMNVVQERCFAKQECSQIKSLLCGPEILLIGGRSKRKGENWFWTSFCLLTALFVVGWCHAKFRFTKCKGNFTLEVIGFCFKPDGLEFQPQAYKVDKDTRLWIFHFSFIGAKPIFCCLKSASNYFSRADSVWLESCFPLCLCWTRSFLSRPRKIKSVLFEIIFPVADKPIYDKR